MLAPLADGFNLEKAKHRALLTVMVTRASLYRVLAGRRGIGA